MPPVMPIEEQTRAIDPAAPHPGAMIAFLLDQETIAALTTACAPLDVAPDHVTLVYLASDAAQLAAHKNALVACVASCAAQQGAITGTVNGYGRFQAVEGDEQTALYANIDCPELPAFRQKLYDAACRAGCEPIDNHGFSPHATLAYLPADTATPDLEIPPIPLTFRSIALVWGGETLTFPLTMPAPLEEPAAMPHVYIERPSEYGDPYRGQRAIRAYCDRAAAEGKPGMPINFVAGSEGIKRDGLNLVMAGGRLDNYRKNPVVLWGHDYTGQRLPIGWAEPSIRGPQILAAVTFDQEDEFARQVESKYRRGFLHTVSLGWNPLKMRGRDVAEWDLLDISAVPVPGDADALIQRQIRALRSLDKDVPDFPDFPTVAADMAALYLFPLARGVRQWRTTYHSLARDYERLGKEPPERLSPDYLATLDSEALAGLFLEDEPALLPELFAKRTEAASPLPPAVRMVLTEMQARIAVLLTLPHEDSSTVLVPQADAPDPALVRLRNLLGVHHGIDS